MTATPAATPTATARFLARLPQLITFFFSLTLVNGFRVLADTYHWTTQPSFNFRDPAQYLVAISFVVTLVWIVSAWLGYSLLIERMPYTVHFGRFFFDVARFSLMFALLDFAFLAGRRNGYQNYLFTIAIFHFMMAAFYVHQIGLTENLARREELRRDTRGHGIRFVTYLVLGLIFYFGVATRSSTHASEVLRYAVVIVTFATLTLWNIRRLSELQEYAQKEAAPVTSKPAARVVGTDETVPAMRP